MLSLAAGTEVSPFITNLLVIAAAAAVVAVIAARFKLQLIPAYLMTGAVIGPFALGLADDKGEIVSIGELAIVFLLFGIGLHLDLGALRVGLAKMVTASVASIFIAFGLILPFALLIADHWTGAAVIALAGALSSTAIVLRVYQDRRELSRMHGRMALAVLVIQDIAVIPFLILVPLLGSWMPSVETVSDDLATSEIGTQIATESSPLAQFGGAAAVVIAIVLAGRFVMPIVLNIGARSGGAAREILVIMALAFAMAAAVSTQLVGISPALGAFLGGFLLASTVFRHQLSGQISTLRDVALSVFFVTVGMTLDMGIVLSEILVIVSGLGLLWLIKGVAIAGACYGVGLSARLSLRSALALAGAGEFGLVIVSLAAGQYGLLTTELVSIVTAIAVLSMLITPFLIGLGPKIPRHFPVPMVAPWVRSATLLAPEERQTLRALRAEHQSKESSDADNPSSEPTPEGASNADDTVNRHVIIAGYGVVGRAVADRLTSAGATVAVIEMNVETVRRQAARGRHFTYGDAADPQVLEHAGIADADAFILTIPDEQAALAAAQTARMLNSSVYIIVRTSYVSKAVGALEAGANDTVIEELVTASAMEKLMLHRFGVDSGTD